MKRLTSLAVLGILLCAMSASAQTDRKVSAFEHHVIKEGQSFTLGDAKLTSPDIYYEALADGTYKAHRLTVQPNGTKTMTEPYLQMVTPTSATICWKTSTSPSIHRVMWGESADNVSNNVNSKVTRLSDTYYWHKAEVTGLQPNHTYYYQVRSGKTTQVYSFRTLPEAGAQGKMRVLIIGDHQRNELSDYEWLLHHAERRLNEKYGEAPLHEHVQFLMNMGDQVDNGALTNYEQNHLYKCREVMSQLPIMTTVGNHELKSDPDVTLYESHYGYGAMEYQGIANGTAKWYAYQTGRILWVVMDSDHTTAEQKAWVRKVVAAADADVTVDCIVSVQHRPLYAEMYSYDVSAWALNEIMPILCASPKHFLNCAGHHHLYARGQLTEWPVYHIISGGGVGTTAEGYEQMFGVCLVDNNDREQVQKTIDQYTYQILEYDSETHTATVETYSVGNRRLALDGELVDRFSRCLLGSEAPAKPALKEPATTLCENDALQQTEAVEGLHSAQYQVANDESFSKILEEHVLTYEDCYWVEDDFRPKDQNAGKPVTTLQLADCKRMMRGTYYVRVRNRNMNLDWSDWSDPVAVPFERKVFPPSITLDAEQYKPGTTITVTLTGLDQLKSDAWVGIYLEGKTPGNTDKSYKWDYINGRTQLTFNITEANGYYAALFVDGGYTEAAERVHFLVNKNYDPARPFTMTLDRETYEEGDPVVISIDGAPCFSKDWVGIYPEGWAPKDSKCPTYLYMGSKASTQLTLNVTGTKNFTEPLPEGRYFVGYFLMDNYQEPFERQYFEVVKPNAVQAPASAIDKRGAVYRMDGTQVAADAASLDILPAGLYIVGGAKVVK